MLYAWLQELADAFTAAGLDARVFDQPDRGPGVIVGAVSGAWDDHASRTGCGDLTEADVRVVVHVLAQGWAPEQQQQHLTDLETVLVFLPGPWRTLDFQPAPGDVTLPEYRLTIER